MKKISKTLRTVIECTLVVLIGGLLISLINHIPTEKEPKVKNIIFMIGDGMGISHITATMIEQDYAPLALERAEYIGLQKTYSADNLITDSAAAGTALAAGTKISVANACAYLSEVGLCAKEYINREVNASLSGGELKRIEIAMINARSTKLSVFDEPEAGIDLWSFNNLIKVFEGMYERTKGSILIISHQERILDIADKIVVIADGTVAQIGSKNEILPTLLAPAGCRYTAKEGN